MLFRTDPEWAHDRVIRAAEWTSGIRPICEAIRRRYSVTDAALSTEVAGIEFQHPVGLAAGFDKNARAFPFWEALGFSHVEIGSVSAEFSAGNPRPRLFRIPGDQGIVVWYGLPNDGAHRVAARIAGTARAAPLGLNLVNTNRGPGAPPECADAIIEDYLTSFRVLEPHADYMMLNLSCPNTPEGRGFLSDTCLLTALLDRLKTLGPRKPVFLKVAPINDIATLERFLTVVEAHDYVSGYGVNLPPGKPPGLRTSSQILDRMPGAVAGRPSAAAANRMTAELYRRIDRRKRHIISSGGVFTAEDAYRKVRLGASLVQVLTALVYEGPGIVRRIVGGLAALLERDGFQNVREAVGVDVAAGVQVR